VAKRRVCNLLHTISVICILSKRKKYRWCVTSYTPYGILAPKGRQRVALLLEQGADAVGIGRSLCWSEATVPISASGLAAVDDRWFGWVFTVDRNPTTLGL